VVERKGSIEKIVVYHLNQMLHRLSEEKKSRVCEEDRGEVGGGKEEGGGRRKN